MIDAWSLTFARQRLLEYRPEFEDILRSMGMYYEGVDTAIWGTRFLKPQYVEPQDAAPALDGPACAADAAYQTTRFHKMTLQSYLHRSFRRPGNVLIFGKILNEIPETEWITIKLGFERSDFSNWPEYYICASHSVSHLKDGTGQQRVKELVDIISAKGKFDVDWVLPEQWNELRKGERFNAPISRWEPSESSNVQCKSGGRDAQPCYCFRVNSKIRPTQKGAKPSCAYITELFNGDELFSSAFPIDGFQRTNKVSAVFNKSFENTELRNEMREPITSCEHIAFQIVKLTRKP